MHFRCRGDDDVIKRDEQKPNEKESTILERSVSIKRSSFLRDDGVG
jgi:hypothetical protein